MSKINVTDDYRRNDLSLTPGGETLTLTYSDGSQRVYDKIKNIRSYSSRAMLDPTVIEIWRGQTLYWRRAQTSL